MPALAFATNFLWVLVLGLLGPNLPAIVADLGITYAQAGFFFTLLSLGSLLGTSLGAIGSDFLSRKLLYGSCVLLLSIGLFALGLVPGYALMAIVIFLLSFAGSPIGAIGQSIMLGMFPGKREKYLSVFTFFGAAGSLLAPLLVSMNFSFSLSWRYAFFEASGLVLFAFVALLFVRIPALPPGRQEERMSVILHDKEVVATALLIFFSVACDLGFSYWLAEYFKAELRASLRISSAVVGVYLIGIIAGRLSIPFFMRTMGTRGNLLMGLAVSLVGIVAFIFVPSVPLKVALCALYGFGVGPVFPLLNAKGTRRFPSRPGAVTGILYGSLSLGGMAFPLWMGFLAGKVGIGTSYLFCALVLAGLFLSVLFIRSDRTNPATR